MSDGFGTNRLAEFFCTIFGHHWNEHGHKKDTELGIILEEYDRCENCGLERHDRSGHLRAFELKYGK